MRRIFFVAITLVCLNFSVVFAGWAEVENVEVRQEPTELAGPRIVIDYQITEPDVTEQNPVYVFVRYSADGNEWNLLDGGFVRGDYGIVNSSGKKQCFWWGSAQVPLPDLGQAPKCSFVDISTLKIKLFAVHMAKVPAGEFKMKAIPGDGRGDSKKVKPASCLPLYYIGVNETTFDMYADFLNEVGTNGQGYNPKMANKNRGGIEQKGDAGQFSYSVICGRQNYPVVYASWYDGLAFSEFCGLNLPTEAQWEKAFSGGKYLDGDETKKIPNPKPLRKYPWGDTLVDANGIYRCNYDSAEDGFEQTSPVGSFAKYNSPYGCADMAGNVAEWTLDWYTTSYHAGLDGFRMTRGGSWLAVAEACDAVTAATQFPLKESSIMGFRMVSK
jgi:formylglycine-generating enzyme required for sulfatase activity